MKAVRVHRFGGPDVLSVEDVPEPQPGAGQLLLRIAAIGVNPVETYIRSGKYGPRAFPYTPGSDGAGVVEAIGPQVTAQAGRSCLYRLDDQRRYAEKTLCSQQTVHPLPASHHICTRRALGVPYATAHCACFHGQGAALAGETLLVHGASGGVGLAAVQLPALGCTIIGTAGTEEGRRLVASEERTFRARSPCRGVSCQSHGSHLRQRRGFDPGDGRPHQPREGSRGPGKIWPGHRYWKSRPGRDRMPARRCGARLIFVG